MSRKTPKCKHCHKAFTPARGGTKYCSTACRQAAYRARLKRQQQPPSLSASSSEAALVVATCANCGGSFWAKNKRQQFCTVSCRSLYSKAARAALPAALGAFYGIPEGKALDMIDALGMKRVRSIIEQAGYQYDHAARRWWNVDRSLASAKGRAA